MLQPLLCDCGVRVIITYNSSYLFATAKFLDISLTLYLFVYFCSWFLFLYSYILCVGVFVMIWVMLPEIKALIMTTSYPLLRICCCGPSAQKISIDCWTTSAQQQRQANAGSATLSAYVGSWTQTCLVSHGRNTELYCTWKYVHNGTVINIAILAILQYKLWIMGAAWVRKS